MTKEQWLQAEHEHVVDGVAIMTLAKKYGVHESALRRRLRPNQAEVARGVNTLRDLAKEKADAVQELALVEGKIAELPVTRQVIVNDLAERMKSITVHLTCAAEASAETSKKLALLARAQANRIDITKPINDKTRDTVSAISAITRTANEAGSIGMGLIAAHRVGLPGSAPGDEPGGVADLTPEELDAELRANGIDPETV